MNAISYIKNVGRSFGYMAVDVLKEYNPAITELASQTKELTTDIYDSIKDFKENSSNSKAESAFKTGKEIASDFLKNSVSDFRTGNWYNKQRGDAADEEMMKEFFGDDFDFNFDDDFGDFDDFSSTDSTKAEMSEGRENTKAMIASMDIVGSKTAATISEATIRSADYIANSNRQANKALYSLTSKGFGEVSKGILAVNNNLTSLVSLAEPLTTHMQNSATFYTHSTEYQNKMLGYMEQLVKNTAPATPDIKKSSAPKGTIDSLMSGDILDLKEYISMVKGNVKESLDLFTGLFGMMPGGAKGMGSQVTKSPISMMLTAGMKALMPKMMKETMTEFNSYLTGMFPALLGSLRGKNFGKFEFIKDWFIPKSGYKNNLDPGKYNKGKVDWDGKARKALMDVIPYQLSLIVSALTGQEQKIFNYDSGKWVRSSLLRRDFNKMKNDAADNVDYEYINMLKSTIDKLKADNGQTEEELARAKERMKRQVDEYNRTAFHSDSADFMNIMKDDFDYARYGLDETTWNLIRDINKANARSGKRSRRMKYNSNMFLARDNFGNRMRNMEGEGSPYEVLFNESGLEDTKKSRGLLGVDEYNHDIFYYLQGIFQYTRHLSDNVVYFGSGRSKGTDGIKKGGKIKGVKPIKAKATEEDRREIDERHDNRGNNTYDRSSLAAALDQSTSEGSLENPADKITDPELKEYYIAREAAKKYNESFTNDAEKDKKIETILKSKGLGTKIKEKLGESTVGQAIEKMSSSIGKLFNVPIETMQKITNTVEASLTHFITGSSEDENEVTLGSLMETNMSDLFSSLKDKMSDFFEKSPKEMAKAAAEKLFGKKGEDGKRSGGFFSNWFNETKDAFGSTGKWMKNVFFGGKESNSDNEESLNPSSRNGRKVTKSGIVSVSEGELIIPAEMNPFYKGKVDKNRQAKTEAGNISKFFGSFMDGGTAGTSARPGEGETQEYNDGTVMGTARNIISAGLHSIASGFGKFINAVMPDEKKLEEEKKKIASGIKDSMKEMGDAKGAMTAGGIIGGVGLSLLTGGLVGPILGAGLGAATGLIIKSKNVQNMLFGYTDDDGEHKGLLNKEMSTFLKENVPSMAKGGVVGGAAGLFMGSPLLGAIVGSGVGYITSSKKAQRILFGTVDENGNPVDDGIISRALQDKLKKAIPNMSAGAIAGLIAGPFGPVGNIIMGSAIGYATSSNKFNEWMFGKKGDPDDKGFAGLIKDNLLNPIVGIFDKLTQEIKHTVRDTFHNLSKSIRGFLNKSFLGRISGKAAQKVAKVAGRSVSGITRGVGNVLGGINNRLEKRALKKGYSIRDRKLGRNLTAEERLARREEIGLGSDGVYGGIDQLLAMAESPEELKDLQTLMSQMTDPTKKFDSELASSKRRIGTMADRFIEEDTSKSERSKLNRVFNLVKKNKYDEAIYLVNKLEISDEKKQQLLAEIRNASGINRNIGEAKGNVHRAQQLILSNTNLKVSDKIKDALGKNILTDSDFMNARDLINDEIGGRFNKSEEDKAKEQHDAVTNRIPDLLTDILHVLAGDENKIKELRGELSSTTLRTEADRMRQTLENANSEVTEDNKPKEGDTKVDAENNKLKFQDGRWVYDNSDTQTNENQERKNKIYDAIMHLPVIGGAITGMSGLFGTLHKKLFGTKNDDGDSEGGLFSNLINSINGSGSPMQGIFNYLTGTKIGQTAKTVLSKITLKGVLTNIAGPALLAAGLGGAFDPIIHVATGGAYGEGGDTNIYYNKDGNPITKKSDGTFVDTNGNVVNSADISVKEGDTSSFSEKLKYNTARGVLTNTKSVASTVMGKTALGKGAKSLASKAMDVVKTSDVDDIAAMGARMNLSTTITDACRKFTGALRKVPALKGMADKLDDMGLALANKATGALASKGARQLADLAKNAVIWVKIAFVVIDFTTGYEDARTTLGIVTEPSVGQKIISGLLRAVKNFIPIVGSLLPDSLIVDVFCDYIAPFLGISPDELMAQREESKAIVNEYNQKNGTNYTIEQYNKSVLQDYTWTERIGNASKTTWEQTKGKFSNMVSGIKEKGFGGYAKESFTNLKNSMLQTYEQEGGGISGVISAIGEGFNQILPGIFGEIPKMNAQVWSYASKGDIKGLWGVTLSDFSQGETGADGVEKAVPGIFSKIIGQIPLIMSKITSTPIAGVIWGVKKVLGLLKEPFEQIKQGFAAADAEVNGNGLTTILDDSVPLADTIDTNMGETSNDNVANSLTGIANVAYNVSKFVLVPIKFVKSIGSKISGFFKDTVSNIKTGINTVINEYNYGKQLLANPNTDLKDYFNISYDDPENPMNGFVKTAIITSRLFVIPTAIVKKIGSSIKDSFLGIVDGVKGHFVNLINANIDLYNISKTGDIDALNNYTYQNDDGNPVAGFTSAMIGINKFFTYIPTGVHWLGNKIKDGIGAAANLIGVGFNNFKSNNEELSKLADSGNVIDIINKEFDAGEDNPLGGFFGSFFGISKTIYTIKGGINFLGTSLKGIVGDLTEKYAANKEKTDSIIDKMKSYADEGDLTSLASTKLEGLESGDPLSFTHHLSFHINKAILTIKGAIAKIAEPVEDMIEGVSEKVTDVKEKATDIKNNVDKKVNDVKEGAVNAYNNAVNVAKETANNVKQGAVNAYNNASAAVNNFAENAYDTFASWSWGGRSGLIRGRYSAGNSFVSQLDPKYANMSVGTSNVNDIGCGPAAAVMAINQINGNKANMRSATSLAGKYQTGNGVDAAFFDAYFKQHGTTATYYQGSNPDGMNNIMNDLSGGNPVILMGRDASNTSKSNSPFGPSNHYVVASGFDKFGNIIVKDPESNKSMTYPSTILNNVELGVGMRGGMAASGSRRKRNGIANRIMSRARKFIGIAGAGPQGTINDLTKYVWKRLIDAGYSPAAAAGVMGNMECESAHWKLDAVGDNGTSFGICQWHKNRGQALKDYAASKGKNWWDIEIQMDYFLKDMPNSIWSNNGLSGIDEFKKLKHPGEACYSMMVCFERPTYEPTKNGLGLRYCYTKTFYDAFSGNTWDYPDNFLAVPIRKLSTKWAQAVLRHGTPSDLSPIVTGNGQKLNVGSVTAPDSGQYTTGSSSSYSGTSDYSSSSSSTGSAGLGGVLGVITSAFSKIGNLFTRSDSEDTSYSSSSATTGGAITNVANISNNENYQKLVANGGSPLDYMKSIKGTLEYSMSGARNPEKGSADCSSTVQWAVKKALGVDIGGSTLAQYSNNNMHTIWYANGKRSTNLEQLEEAGLRPNDILLFSRPNAKHSVGRPDRVGHVEMYAGNGQMIGHPGGSGLGPKLRDIKFNSDGPIMVRRINGYEYSGASAAGSGLFDTLANTASNIKDNISEKAASRKNRLMGTSAEENTFMTKIKSTIKGEVNSASGISKETAALLKVIISLIETLVSNTGKIDNIYQVLTEYCKANLGANAAKATAAIDNIANNSSDTGIDDVLKELKLTVDSLLA